MSENKYLSSNAAYIKHHCRVQVKISLNGHPCENAKDYDKQTFTNWTIERISAWRNVIPEGRCQEQKVKTSTGRGRPTGSAIHHSPTTRVDNISQREEASIIPTNIY